MTRGEVMAVVIGIVRESVLREREAGARLCDTWAGGYRADGEDTWAESVEMVADAIRERAGVAECLGWLSPEWVCNALGAWSP